MADTEKSGKRKILGLPGQISVVSVGVFLRQCVFALSRRFLSESMCDPLYGDASTHREACHLGISPHAQTGRDPLRPPQEDPKHKIYPSKAPTSILRRRSNLIGLSQKSDRRVRFSDPEFTVHTYCTPGRSHLIFLACRVILVSVPLLVLFYTSWHQSQRLCEGIQAVIEKVVWGSWHWFTMQ